MDISTLPRPTIWPSVAVNARFWDWGCLVAHPWKFKSDHINNYELRGALTAMKWRARTRRRLGCKFLHLLDSKVAIAVATKRRSSSRKLLRTSRKMDALELAAHFAPIYGYVRSQANLTDGPSRRRNWRTGGWHRRNWPSTAGGVRRLASAAVLAASDPASTPHKRKRD